MLNGTFADTEAVMALAVAGQLGRMSLQEFLDFYDTRPEYERWELYDGVPVQMMTPPFPAHQRIGYNLTRLLDDALAIHDSSRLALFCPGLQLPEAGTYRPEPDVAVIDVELPSDRRYIDRAYLLAEIVSSTDRERVPGTRVTKIEAKRDVYRRHPPCEAVLTIEQDRMEILLDLRTGAGWTSQQLKSPADELVLPSFGLRCQVKDLYANTPLKRARSEPT